MRNWTLAGVVAVVVLVLALPARSASAQQDPEVKKQLDAMKAQMDELRQENQALRNRLDAVERKEPPKRGFTDEDKKLLGGLIDTYMEKGPEIKKYPGKPQLSGVLFAQYGMQLKSGDKIRSDGSTANAFTSDSANGRDAAAFDVTRAYFIVREELTESLSMRLTFDGAAKRNPGDASGFGTYAVVLKHAFLEYKDLIPATTLVFGMADLPWVSWEEGLYGYRMQGTVFADRNGYLTSTDFGAGVKGKLPSGYGDYHVAYINGEGWSRAEGFFRHSAESTGTDSFDTKHKNVEARLSLVPFPEGGEFLKGLMFTGFVDYGKYASARDTRVRTIGAVTWKYEDWFRLMGQYLYASDPRSFAPRAGNQLLYPTISSFGTVDRSGTGYRRGTAVAEGFSLWNVVNFKILHESLKDFEFVQRYDWIDPDEEVPNNGNLRTIHGIAYNMSKNVTLMLDYETVRYDKARAAFGSSGAGGPPTFDDGTGDTRPDTAQILFQTQIKF
ncbi:MAG: hypothetical protein HZA54_01605 [Planctomycetes bacterium]|nr:hypothetical protein [Planctomycetota bacterium]